jgi:hypothetical protein
VDLDERIGRQKNLRKEKYGFFLLFSEVRTPFSLDLDRIRGIQKTHHRTNWAQLARSFFTFLGEMRLYVSLFIK